MSQPLFPRLVQAIKEFDSTIYPLTTNPMLSTYMYQQNLHRVRDAYFYERCGLTRDQIDACDIEFLRKMSQVIGPTTNA